ncbi:MAG: alkaline phosphatase family protein [Acidobacteriota bacterium]
MTRRCLLSTTVGLLVSWALVAQPPAADSPPSDSAPPAPTRLMLVSWDGAGDFWLDRLLDEGHMPQLRRMIASGTRARHLVGTAPSKTAPSHASIYTGCGPAVHGVTANTVGFFDNPGDHTVLAGRNGFSADVLRAEPLFVTASKAGRRVAILSASHYIPHQTLIDRFGPLGDAGFLSFSSFRQEIVPATVIGPDEIDADGTFRVVLGDTVVDGRLLDDPADPVDGFDTVRLVVDGDETTAVTLTPRPTATTATARTDAWSRAVPIRGARRDGVEDGVSATFFRLFELAPDGSSMVLYHRRAGDQVGVFSDAERAAYGAIAPGGHDEPFRVYGRGGLGQPIGVGGDGTAEDRMVEIAAFDMDLRIAGTRMIWGEWRPDVLFHYTPLSDQYSHGWVGHFDPATALYDPAIADAMWPYYAAFFDQLDRWLGVLLALAEADGAILGLVSDHGMAGADRNLHVAQLLADAGLLHFDDDGQVDLTKTQVLPTPGEFAVQINDVAWQGGIVPLEDRRAVLTAATDALLAARDADGKPLVVQVVDPSEHSDWLSTAAAEARDGKVYGDALHFDLAPGVYARGRPRASDALVTPVPSPWAQGVHGYSPHRRLMHAMFYLAGPGVRRGVETPSARQIDVAPTVAHLIGLPAPRDACGRVLFEALTSTTPMTASPETR